MNNLCLKINFNNVSPKLFRRIRRTRGIEIEIFVCLCIKKRKKGKKKIKWERGQYKKLTDVQVRSVCLILVLLLYRYIRARDTPGTLLLLFMCAHRSIFSFFGFVLFLKRGSVCAILVRFVLESNPAFLRRNDLIWLLYMLSSYQKD